MTRSKRFWITNIWAVLLLAAGIGAYVHSPEHIDNLALYMGTIVLVVLGYNGAETYRPSGTTR